MKLRKVFSRSWFLPVLLVFTFSIFTTSCGNNVTTNPLSTSTKDDIQDGNRQPTNPDPDSRQEPVPEVKVALFGDTEAGNGFTSVLKLATAEKANIVVINGDFGYGSSSEIWKSKLKAAINTDTTLVIGAIGNHEIENGETNAYITIFDGLRTPLNELKKHCTGTPILSEGHDIVAVDETCTFGNVSIIESGIGQVLSTNYLENRLESKLKATPINNWKLVGYHFTLANMNPGIKGDQATFKFFDLIRQYGAIGAQAHTHSVMASCPIVSQFAKGAAVKCHPDFSTDLESRFVSFLL